MSKIRAIAIDDEPIALEVISRFCNRLGGIELSVFSDPDKGFEAIVATRPDLVFLDIEMNDVSGLQIAQKMPKDIGFIFTTAYAEYALAGFNLDAFDFLHKPFSYDRFVSAVEKSVRRLEYTRLADVKKTIVVRQEYANVPIRISEILYMEAMGNYTKIYLTDGEMILAHNSLKWFCDRFDAHIFIRIHKSLMVASDKIKCYNRQSVKLINDKTLPVGRSYSHFITSR